MIGLLITLIIVFIGIIFIGLGYLISKKKKWKSMIFNV
jgi:hypothetical protein